MITEETAMLYCVNKPAMRQRLDVAHGHIFRAEKGVSTLPMTIVPAAAPMPERLALRIRHPPVRKPEPHHGLLRGVQKGWFKS